jgi:signal transduction histidine kinase
LSEEIDLYIEEIKMKNSEREQIKVLAGIGEMAAKVAHEVRNPLNTIDGAIHYLRRTTSNQDDQAEYLDLIDENIHRINNVASELLDATRPARPVLEKINVIRLLQERILESSRKFNNSEIIINFEAIGDIPIMFVDKHQIIQVIDNLLENAVNACEEKGKGIINIHLKKITPTPMQNFLLIRIIDNGYGIPSENLGKIFQPFFTTKSSGTGLGLSIVENIIKNHRGEINIISKLNKGTFIKIKLPLRT